MKNNCTAVKTSIDRTYTDLQQMEAAIKQQLATLRLQLGSWIQMLNDFSHKNEWL